MDALALLCNLHADGPETLRRLRRAGISDLKSLFQFGQAGIEPLLGRDARAAERFLREARLLAHRQSLIESEVGSGRAPGSGTTLGLGPEPGGSDLERRPPQGLDHSGSVSEPDRGAQGADPRPTAVPFLSGDATRPSAGPEAPNRGEPRFAASEAASPGPSGEGYPAAPKRRLFDAVLPVDGFASPGPRQAPTVESPGKIDVTDLVQAEWVGDAGEGAGDEPAGLGDYVIEPQLPRGGDSLGEPRHSVLGALLAAWSRGAPGLVTPEPEAALPAAAVSAGGSTGNPAPTDPDPLAPRSALGAVPLAALLRPAAPPSNSPSKPSEELREAPASVADLGLDQAPDRVLEPDGGTPLQGLLVEPVDPAAVGRLADCGVQSLEALLQSDPRELSQRAGLPYTLVLRLQYLARRNLRDSKA